MTIGRFHRGVFVLAVPMVAVLVAFTTGTRAKAEGGTDTDDARSRCANRLSLTLVGELPDAELSGATNPLDQVDRLLQTPKFSNRFASYLNSEFNSGPSESVLEDTVYFLSKYVLENDKPWKELFVGHYDMFLSADKQGLDVRPTDTGLGYFRTQSWMRRYAGNEEQGVRISSAFRMIQNTTGTQVTPSVGKPGEDRSVNARQNAPCNGCHFNQWFALDKAAAVLSLKKVAADGTISFVPNPATAPQQLFGKTIKDDREMVEALVDSESWKFGQCRYVFRYLFGRPESTCEATLFDKCVDALESKGTIKAAVAAIAKDERFCQ